MKKKVLLRGVAVIYILLAAGVMFRENYLV